MEIIEKQVEKVKEVPYGYGYYDGYGRNVVGKATVTGFGSYCCCRSAASTATPTAE